MYMTAQEVAEALGVSLATVYAYVSRGLIRSEAQGVQRSRRYRAEDVRTLMQRKEGRRDLQQVTDGVLHWGLPVLDSAITLLDEGGIFYRGYSAFELAQTHTVEQVASLLWTGGFDVSFEALPSGWSLARWRGLLDAMVGCTLFERFQALMPLVGTEDWAAYDLRPAAVVQSGARLLRVLVALASGNDSLQGSLSGTLSAAWAPAVPGAERLLQAALVLCADHELNVSTFAARCAASAGSPPFAVVSAGLAALQGYRHGGGCDRVEALFAEVGAPECARDALARRLRRGESIPGFGQPLYPGGDPRWLALRELLGTVLPDAPELVLVDAIATAAHELIGEYPNLDFALVAVSTVLGLQSGAAIALFAMGRSIGWIGHALEQYQSDRLIRPRARYIGAPPGSTAPNPRDG